MVCLCISAVLLPFIPIKGGKKRSKDTPVRNVVFMSIKDSTIFSFFMYRCAFAAPVSVFNFFSHFSDFLEINSMRITYKMVLNLLMNFLSFEKSER